MKSSKRLIQAMALALLSVLLISCEAVSFYSQAARGQLAIVFSRQDIHRLLGNDDLPVATRDKFQQVLAIRDFAQQELQLPVGDHFSSYVDLDREHVVWNVYAAPEFSLDPVSWCYPIAGCVSYRGYFSEAGAQRYAERLKEQGFDVYTGGVDAYSTLGWFEDSLLSTILNRQSFQLAGLIFHEMAHQVVYVPGETAFNESFATAVEREGIRRWLLASDQQDQLQMALVSTTRQQQFNALVGRYQEQFAELYDESIDRALMRSRKAELQQAMRRDYEQLKMQWQGYAGYDSWFGQSLNNAQLSTVSTYNDYVPFFDSLLQEVDGDFARFYESVRELAELSPEERQQRLSVSSD